MVIGAFVDYLWQILLLLWLYVIFVQISKGFDVRESVEFERVFGIECVIL